MFRGLPLKSGKPRAPERPKSPPDTDAARWLAENREALDAWNAWVEANGLPLEKMRLF